MELHTTSSQNYLYNTVVSIVKTCDIVADISQREGKIICAFASEHENLQACLDTIAQKLPASIFLKASKSYANEEEVSSKTELKNEYPLNLGLCPSCQKEMFDVSSRRYYYPFTSCSCCGGNYSFLNTYPYERKTPL
ncbi:hypothetical protein [Sulfurimonas sp. NW9]|uniref:hypothetical protein n=1 Tax=Sulfurimonas sp. NW9 TaxID=2922728 RepID=UPI003DAA394E